MFNHQRSCDRRGSGIPYRRLVVLVILILLLVGCKVSQKRQEQGYVFAVCREVFYGDADGDLHDTGMWRCTIQDGTVCFKSTGALSCFPMLMEEKHFKGDR